MATDSGGTPVKVIKLSANVIDSKLANIINKYIDLNGFSENAKIAKVWPVFKEDERTKVKNNRLVSFLNIFSKIHERFIHENLTTFKNSFLSEFISVCRKTYSIHHVLIRLIENWKNYLDQNSFAGAAFMGISEAAFLWLCFLWLTNCKNACIWIFRWEFDLILFVRTYK